MNLDPGPATRSLLRWWRLLLAALAAAVVTVLGAGTASAATVPILETRVGASTLATVSVVGPHECITAGQQWGHALPRAEPTVASIPSAGTVTYDCLSYSFDRPPHGALSDNGSSHCRVLQSRADTAAPDAFPQAVGVGVAAKSFATGADEAVFWSGVGRGGDKIAAQWVAKNGGATLETTMASRGITLPAWDASNPAVVSAWRDASAQFARGASGNVRVLQGDAVRIDSVWAQVEYPALTANPNVTSITAINPSTGASTVLWSR